MAYVGNAQTIRNTNNSVVAKIDTDGTIRNSNNSVIGRINSNGDIRDGNNHYLGEIYETATTLIWGRSRMTVL